MLGTVAPWLIPPNYLEAIRSGTSAGLQLGQMRQSDELARERLQAAYDQLAERERHQDYIAQLREQGRQAAIDMQRERNDNLLQLGQQRLEMEQNKLDDIAGRFDTRQDYRERELQLKQDNAAALQDYRDQLLEARGGGDKSEINRLRGRSAMLEEQIYEEQSKAQPDADRILGLSKARYAHEKKLGELLGKSDTLQAEPQTKSSKRVRVKSPDGKTGTIPEDQLDAAKAAGYTVE